MDSNFWFREGEPAASLLSLFAGSKAYHFLAHQGFDLVHVGDSRRFQRDMSGRNSPIGHSRG
jgi:hypothetical protein